MGSLTPSVAHAIGPTPLIGDWYQRNVKLVHDGDGESRPLDEVPRLDSEAARRTTVGIPAHSRRAFDGDGERP